jgi:hypothetical protein
VFRFVTGRVDRGLFVVVGRHHNLRTALVAATDELRHGRAPGLGRLRVGELVDVGDSPGVNPQVGEWLTFNDLPAGLYVVRRRKGGPLRWPVRVVQGGKS